MTAWAAVGRWFTGAYGLHGSRITAHTIRAAVLLANAIAATLVGLRPHQGANPRSVACRSIACIPEHGDRACYEQAADIFVAALAGASQPFLATLEFCLGVIPSQASSPQRVVSRQPLTTVRDHVDYNLAYIGPDFTAKAKEDFDPVFMRALYDFGRAKARTGDAWAKRPPWVPAGETVFNAAPSPKAVGARAPTN